MSRRVLVGGAILLLLLATAGIFGRALGPSSPVRFPSSFAAEPEGLLAFRRMLGEIGVPTGTRSTSWDDLLTDPVPGVLVLATPLQRPPDEDETRALASWLERGRALLVVDDAGALERSPMLDRLLESAGVAGRAPATALDPMTGTLERPAESAASGSPAFPAGRDLRRLSLHAQGGLDDDASGVPLALNGDGNVVAALGALGRGRIVRVYGPLLANDRLLAGDNLEFALRLVRDLRRNGPVIFDEYHHGYGGLLPRSRGIDRAGLLAAGAQALLATALFGAARGVRKIPAVASPERRRRSSLEFVRSLASLYRRARARRHVLESELARFEREARSRWESVGAVIGGPMPQEGEGAASGLRTVTGTDESHDPGDDVPNRTNTLAAAIAAHGLVPAERVAAVLGAARASLERPSLTEKDMLARAADLARLEREVFGGS